MKTKEKSLRMWAAMFLFSMAAFVISCTKTADPIAGDVAQTASNESAVTSQTSETDDMAASALVKTDAPPARVANTMADDDRFKCATVLYDTASFKTKGSGKITINFGTGCTDSKGNVRIGKIIIAWSGGRWYSLNAVHSISFSGYSINGVKFSDNDYRTVKCIQASPLKWTVEAVHNLTWPDATTASRTVHETRQWVHSTTDDKFIISQTAGAANAASGKNRHAKEYSVQITTPIEYSRACAISNKVFLPVTGVKVITYDATKTVTIDFGTGTCDNIYTISITGHSKTVTAKNDSSGD
jgi:hypothetical protein